MSCITLLSDFGLQDATVAAVKGLLMQKCNDIPIIDISHDIEPFHLQQASYLLKTSIDNFPDNSVHLVLFDLYYDKEPHLLLYEYENKYYLAPNNGILPLTFGDGIKNVWRCSSMGINQNISDWVDSAANVINSLKDKDTSELGFEIHEIKNAPRNRNPIINENIVECQVIHIDRFENVVLNITKDEFERIGNNRPFSIRFMRDEQINTLSTHYNSVKNGNKLCRFNSANHLEIAINRGKAASLFGLKMKKEQQLFYNTIKIEFE